MAFPKLMTIAHAGGEYLSLNLSGLGGREHEVDDILREAETVLHRPSANKNIGFHVYGTRVNARVAEQFADWLSAVDGLAYRVAVIGLTLRGRLALARKTAGKKYGFGLKRFSSIDASKDWLVGKG